VSVLTVIVIVIVIVIGTAGMIAGTTAAMHAGQESSPAWSQAGLQEARPDRALTNGTANA
jgi:hypothetical protein